MMTVGGNPVRAEHRLLARRIRLGGLLVAMLMTMALAAGVSGNAYAQLSSQVTVTNSGAIQGGSLETFAEGQKGDQAALYDVAGPLTLLGQYSAGGILGSLLAPSGNAISPVDGHVYVTDSYTTGPGLVLVFSPSASGNSAPEQIIYDESMVISPNGVAFDVGNAHPTVYGAGKKSAVSSGGLWPGNAAPSIETEGDVYVASLFPELTYEGKACSYGSITEFLRTDGTPSTAGAFPAPSTPVFGIQGCGTALVGPVGLFVDETVLDLCVGEVECASASNCTAAAAALCETGEVFPYWPTRRIWAVNRFAGFVTIYAPEFAWDLGVADCNGSNICNEPPLGGFFYTTEGDGDTTTPNYIALDQPETRAFITDLTGGAGNAKHPHGRVKTFDLLNYPSGVCLYEFESGGNYYCSDSYGPFVVGEPAGDLSGTATKLYMPLGIGAQTDGEDNVTLFVANANANTVEQFGPNPTGDIPATAKLQGGHTKLNQPAGLAVPPVPFAGGVVITGDKMK